MASFVQNNKYFEILWFKKNFFSYVRNLETTSSPIVPNNTYLGSPLLSPFVRTYYVHDPLVKKRVACRVISN